MDSLILEASQKAPEFFGRVQTAAHAADQRACGAGAAGDGAAAGLAVGAAGAAGHQRVGQPSAGKFSSARVMGRMTQAMGGGAIG